MKRAVEKYGRPQILNTDQANQSTAYAFCDWVTDPSTTIQLSMDGIGRATDNVFIEPLWRSVKYEHGSLFPVSDGRKWYRGLKEYFEYDNPLTRDQSVDDQHPQTVDQPTFKIAAPEMIMLWGLIHKKWAL